MQATVELQMPRCPGCGSRDLWQQDGARYVCGCGDWRGRADAYVAVSPVGQDPTPECPRGHGYLHPHSDAWGSWHLCVVCGLVVYEQGGPVRTHASDALEWGESRRKAMEHTLSWVGRFWRHGHDIERWLAQGKGNGAVAVFGSSGRVSNPTMDRALQVLADPTVAMIGTRIRQIDAVYRDSLDPVCKQFASLSYFGVGQPSRESVCMAMGGIALRTYYVYRGVVLDAFCDGLPGGWEHPQAWWGASPLEA